MTEEAVQGIWQTTRKSRAVARKSRVTAMSIRKKKISQQAHMKRRTLQRFGIELNRHDLADIVATIRAGKSEFIDRRSNRTARHRIKFKDASMDVIYDNIRKTVVTALFTHVRR